METDEMELDTIGDRKTALFVIISDTDDTFNLLAIYQTEGPDEGLYVENDSTLRCIVRKLKPTITNREYGEVRQALRDNVERAERCQDRDLIPVNNGIFHYGTKTLLPFSPDLIFLSKSRVNYNPRAQNVVIHNPNDGTDWDVESWMQELSDNPEIVNLLSDAAAALIY